MRSDQYISVVLSKCETLKQSGLWSGETKVRPRAWLSNFDSADQPIAAVLLDHFVYYSNAAVDRMLLSGFRGLRDRIYQVHGVPAGDRLLDNAIFTSVEGEDPNVTDSGKLFCRKLRQLVGLPDARFLEPVEALAQADAGRLVVFLDDFVGSGDQMAQTWRRSYRASHPVSFADASSSGAISAAYLTLVASRTGVSRLAADANGLAVLHTHELGNNDGVAALPRNSLRPDGPDIAASIAALLSSYATRLRLPPYIAASAAPTLGWGGAGYLLAFEHSTPDASVPLLWAEGTGSWTPLVRRT